MKRFFKTLCGVGVLCAAAFVAYQIGTSEGYEKGKREYESVVPEPELDNESVQSADEASEGDEESTETIVSEDEVANEKTDE